MDHRILIADDNSFYTSLCTDLLASEPGFVVDTAATPGECLERLKSASYDLVILDIDFSDSERDGLSIIPDIKALRPDVSILMHSNNHERDTVIRARRLGADDFASKSNSVKELSLRVRAILARREEDATCEQEAKDLAARVGAAFESAAMHKVFATVARLRRVPALNILIQGETGTGKELIAEALSRKDQGRPFVAVNCAAIPENLIESELFGHVRGAFTGAMRDHRGKFEDADGGDIFLDEVACLPLAAQTALLRVLEKKEVQRVGSREVKKLSFRVIAATNENLEALVAAGKFREELLARLDGRRIKLPSLAERREDILPIVQKILAQEGAAEIVVTRDCGDLLHSLPWPKNVRQLRQTVLSMLATASGGMLTLADIPDDIFQEKAPSSPTCATRAENGKLVLEFDLDDVTFDGAWDALLRGLIEAKRTRLGARASQVKLAESLKMPRSSLQRYLERSTQKSPPS